MTTLTLRTAPFTQSIVAKAKDGCALLLRALDAFAENRMRNAVPEHELLRAEREIRRCRRLVRRKVPAKKRARA
jgi:hypothetical protein